MNKNIHPKAKILENYFNTKPNFKTFRNNNRYTWFPLSGTKIDKNGNIWILQSGFDDTYIGYNIKTDKFNLLDVDFSTLHPPDPWVDRVFENIDDVWEYIKYDVERYLKVDSDFNQDGSLKSDM